MSHRSRTPRNAAVRALLGVVGRPRVALIGVLVVAFVAYLVALDLRVGRSLGYLLFVGLLFHFLVYSRRISTPFLYSLLYCSLLVPMFHASPLVGIVAFFAGLLVFFHRALADQDWYHPAPLVTFFAGLLVHAVVLTPLLVGDTTSYFAQLERYASIGEYVSLLTGNLLSNPIWLGGFLEKLPIVYLPFYFSLDLSSPLFIVLVNGVLWVLTVLMLTRLSEEYVASRLESFSTSLCFALLLVSPTFLLYASQFNKEVTVTFASILSVYLFLKERYVSFLLVAIVAAYLRPYTIVAIAVYIFFFEGRLFLMAGTAVGALGVLLVDSGQLVAVLNGILILPYLFVSPLPVELENWTAVRAGLRPLESALVGLVALASPLVAFLDRKLTREYLLLALGLAAWAVTLAWVGFDRIQKGNFDGSAYDLFVLGVHVARKKTVVQPLILMWVVVTIGALRRYYVDVKLKVN